MSTYLNFPILTIISILVLCSCEKQKIDGIDQQAMDISKWMESPDPDTTGKTVIFTRQKNLIDVNRIPTNLEDLCPSIDSAIKSDHAVILMNSRKTDYDFYVSVYDNIWACYINLLDKMAINQYGFSFDECSPEIQQQLKDEHPFTVIETKPK